MLDFIRLASAVPALRVGDVDFNAARIIESIDALKSEGNDKAVLFPELCVTGYTCGDLFLQDSLLCRAEKAIYDIAAHTVDDGGIYIIGAPMRIDGMLFNCAVVLCRGKAVGIVPKTFIPNSGEFYERRWFSPARYLVSKSVDLLGYDVPVGADLLFKTRDGVTFGIEICEDLWTPCPPSVSLTLGGAEVIFNPSASNELVSKIEYRRQLIMHQSASCTCAYCYCSSGADESTTDLVFSGKSVFACNGSILAENDGVAACGYTLATDVDIGRVRADRIKNKSFAECADLNRRQLRTVCVDASLGSDGKYIRAARLPFVPSTKDERQKRCREIMDIQVAGLKKRLTVTGARPVIGVSGGLDSTLALLVAAKTAAVMGKGLDYVVGITMRGFGTTKKTYHNAIKLMTELGIKPVEISIVPASLQHFKDIGHDGSVHDVTYENTQARERTQILMDYANKVGGLVVGTGDLSELALGWCTYNADHMSMYGVNSSIPKTLVRWLIESAAEDASFASAKETLLDILDTPISPELLPPDADGKIAQRTEEKVGPYALHDFFIYYMLRFGFSPKKIYFLAKRAFEGQFDGGEILKWLREFYRRFFTQQFKRSCLPDGAKVGRISLSPRGDFRMPSDASYALWMKEIDEIRL